jgi:hypothetical protein
LIKYLSLSALLILSLTFATIPPVEAWQTDRLPEPHLGYGIHLDPNVPVDPAIVDRLGMDWVKLYADHQIPLFQNKRILYRQDIDLTNDWEAFRRWMAERARFLASQGVDAIEVHNEPNLSLEWKGQIPNAAEYTTMLRNAYQAIKSVAPDMIVVSAGLAPTITTPDRKAITDIDYAREMLANGAGDWFDAFGYHPYGYNAPPEDAPAYGKLNFRRAELIWDLLTQYGITDKQIWMTEFGWLRDPAEDGVSCSESDPDFAGFAWLRVDGQTQADYIGRAFAYADRNWEWAGPMFLWNLNFSQRANDGSLPVCSHMRWFGLLKNGGGTTPAFDRVVAMPKRYSRYQPHMKLYADDMTLETSIFCAGRQRVGRFNIGNTGYPGAFVASIDPAESPQGPPIEVSNTRARSGQTVEVFVDTTALPAGVYLVYINIRTSIGGQLRAQNLRGFVIVRDTPVVSCE